MRRPRIGITCHPRIVAAGSGDTRAHTVAHFYVDGVVAAGGIPFLLPVVEPDLVPDLLANVDGVLLTGGGDVDPAHYDESPHTEIKAVDAARDAFDLAVARAVLDGEGSAPPALCICRGMQVLNVAAGGTLVQHLPDVGAHPHDRGDVWGGTAHRVRVADDSRLAGLLGASDVEVNSLHHQAIGVPGPGVRPVAWAGDGTVEAVEVEGRDGIVAVQWHPELLPDRAPHSSLFAWLVRQACGTG